jgi:hypothetical protein
MWLSANSNLELPTYFNEVDMNNKTSLTLLCLTFTLLLSACATSKLMQAPDTARGDKLKPEYMVGGWCTDWELTTAKNEEAGQGLPTKLNDLNWSFKEGGSWQVNSFGWVYENAGKWHLKAGERQTLVIQRENEKAVEFQANFKDGDMYLERNDGKFVVLSDC